MHIAWGVMGYGRGHATRTLSLLPLIQQHHEVTVFAGGDAYDLLHRQVPTVRIPTLGYRYGPNGRHAVGATLRHNLPDLIDLLGNGPGRRQVARAFEARGIDAVISDSEAWTHRTAMALGLPRISFDHVGIIAYCKPHFPADLWLTGLRDSLAYRFLMGVPEHIVISSFYSAEPAYPQVRLVGPMLRPMVRNARPEPGRHLLAYFNKGQHQFRPALEQTLRELDLPVVIYGTDRRGCDGNLTFCAPSETGFVDHLARARAVIATAGNQLTGECLHLRKPLLALPEDAFEQRLNAYLIDRLGMGQQARLDTLTPSQIDAFLANVPQFVERMQDQAGDGVADAAQWILSCLNQPQAVPA